MIWQQLLWLLVIRHQLEGVSTLA